jgi:hypothetical protein
MEIEKEINSNDAAFVMTIHTEKRSFGDENSVGHVNAWFNNAHRQPMCLILLIGESFGHMPMFFLRAFIEFQRTVHAATLKLWSSGLKQFDPTPQLFFQPANASTTLSTRQTLATQPHQSATST